MYLLNIPQVPHTVLLMQGQSLVRSGRDEVDIRAGLPRFLYIRRAFRDPCHPPARYTTHALSQDVPCDRHVRCWIAATR